MWPESIALPEADRISGSLGEGSAVEAVVTPLPDVGDAVETGREKDQSDNDDGQPVGHIEE